MDSYLEFSEYRKCIFLFKSIGTILTPTPLIQLKVYLVAVKVKVVELLILS